jgi:Tol biopolymer transport system component
VSPDGRTLVFSRARTDNLSELHRISVSPQMTAAGDAVRLTNLQRYTISPAWSADGRDLIFASGSSYWTTLWRVRASGAGRAEPLPFAAEGSWQTAMAPSGRRLAYTASYYDWNIWRVDLAETGRAAAAPRALISSTRQDGSPGYSPDGTRIAFTSKRSGGNEVWVCDSDGSNPLKLTALGAAYPLAPEWSPDGHWISFIAPGDGREDLLVIGAQGGEPRRVAGDVSRAAQPRWSADGRWIYFSSTRSGTERIWRVPAQGGEPTLTPRLHLGPASADGQFVFFTKDEGASLWKAPAEGGAEVLVVDGFHAKSFAVVQEGVYFVFREEPAGGMRRTLKFYRFADGSTRAVFELPAPKVALAGAGDSRLAVSPDGRAIAYEQQDQNVWDLMLVENFR